MTQWWSWGLTAWGILGLFLAARRPVVGFSVNIAGQVAWLTYAYVTRQWGFVLSAVLYAAVFARLVRAARREAERRAYLEANASLRADLSKVMRQEG